MAGGPNPCLGWIVRFVDSGFLRPCGGPSGATMVPALPAPSLQAAPIGRAGNGARFRFVPARGPLRKRQIVLRRPAVTKSGWESCGLAPAAAQIGSANASKATAASSPGQRLPRSTPGNLYRDDVESCTSDAEHITTHTAAAGWSTQPLQCQLTCPGLPLQLPLNLLTRAPMSICIQNWRIRSSTMR